MRHAVPVIYLALITMLAMTVLALQASARQHGAYIEDQFVRLIEAREGIVPGQARVIPDCGCTVRYVGTQVIGNRYKVVFDKLD